MKKSLHASFNLSRFYVGFRPKSNYDLITIPYAVSFFNLKRRFIYGAIGSVETLKKISLRKNILGAYVRIEEGAGLKGLFANIFNSLTNTQKFRKKDF